MQYKTKLHNAKYTYAKCSRTPRQYMQQDNHTIKQSLNNYRQLQGYDVLTTRAKVINDDMEQHYETFVDCSDWKDAAASLLVEVANGSVSLKVCLKCIVHTRT